MRIKQLVALYLQALSDRVTAGDYSAANYQIVRGDLSRWVTLYGARSAMSSRPDDLIAYLRSNPRWRSVHTRKRVISEVLACYSWAAHEARIIPGMPLRKPKYLRLPAVPRREASDDEQHILLTRTPPHIRYPLLYMRQTGCRPAEMRSLRYSDIDWSARVVVCRRHKTMRLTGQPRYYGLDSATIELLRQLRDRSIGQGNDYVFLNAHGRPWTKDAFCRAFRRACQRLGLPVDLSAYCLRHSWATAAVDCGLTERQIADQLGHAGTRLVAWYAKNRQRASSLRTTVETVARAVERKGFEPSTSRVR